MSLVSKILVFLNVKEHSVSRFIINLLLFVPIAIALTWKGGGTLSPLYFAILTPLSLSYTHISLLCLTALLTSASSLNTSLLLIMASSSNPKRIEPFMKYICFSVSLIVSLYANISIYNIVFCTFITLIVLFYYRQLLPLRWAFAYILLYSLYLFFSHKNYLPLFVYLTAIYIIIPSTLTGSPLFLKYMLLGFLALTPFLSTLSSYNARPDNKPFWLNNYENSPTQTHHGSTLAVSRDIYPAYSYMDHHHSFPVVPPAKELSPAQSFELRATNTPTITLYIDTHFLIKPEAILLWRQLNPEVPCLFSGDLWYQELTNLGCALINDAPALKSGAYLATIHPSSVPFVSLRYMLEYFRSKYGPDANYTILDIYDPYLVKFETQDPKSIIATMEFSPAALDYIDDGHLGISSFANGIFEKIESWYSIYKQIFMKSSINWEQMSIRNILLPHLRQLMTNPTIPTLRKRTPESEAVVMFVTGASAQSASRYISVSIQNLKYLKTKSSSKHFILYTDLDIPSDVYDTTGIEVVKTKCHIPPGPYAFEKPVDSYLFQKICVFQITNDLPYHLDRVLFLDYDIALPAGTDLYFSFDAPFMAALSNPLSYMQGGIYTFDPNIDHFGGIIDLYNDPMAPRRCTGEFMEGFIFHDETVLGCYFRDKGFAYLPMELNLQLKHTSRRLLTGKYLPTYAVHYAGTNGFLLDGKIPVNFEEVDLYTKRRLTQWSAT